MRLLISIVVLLTSTQLMAQRFWLTTYSAPPVEYKTCLTGMEDTILFVGTPSGIWRSDNAGFSWKRTPATKIHALYVSPSRQVLAGGEGKIYFSYDKGITWDSVQLETTHPVKQIIGDHEGGFIAITKLVPATGIPEGNGVFYSAGNLITWEKRNNGLPVNAPCDHIAIDRNGKLYLLITDEDVTGEGGMFASTDKGLTWRRRKIHIQGDAGTESLEAVPQYNYGLAISPTDSIFFSFQGLSTGSPRTLVEANVVKSIDDIDDENIPWRQQDEPQFKTSPRTTIHFAKNGDRYSAIPDLIATGGTYLQRNGQKRWELHKEGLGNTITGFSQRQYFYETAYGKIYMVQLEDERIYWTDESIVNPKRISGKVTDHQQQAKLINFQLLSDTKYGASALDGSYVIVVPGGWSGKVVPYLRTHVISPAELIVENIQSDLNDQNFIVSESVTNHLIEGVVYNPNGEAVEDVNITGLPESQKTNEDGKFGIVVPDNWSGVISAVSPKFAFSPVQVKITNLKESRTDIFFSMNERNSFIISGKIADQLGQPLQNVLLSGFSDEVLTDANGVFSVVVPLNWSGEIIPSKTDFIFVPKQISITNLQYDLKEARITAWHAGYFTVNGKITDDNGNGIPSIVLQGFPETAVTDEEGRFSTTLTKNWSGTITPVSQSYAFSPDKIEIDHLNEQLIDLNFSAHLVTGINDELMKNSRVYPNPSEGKFIIEIISDNKSLLEIISSTGATIMRREVEGAVTEVEIADKGLFIVKVNTGNKTSTSRIIIR